jgi:hypothetical protein
MTIVRSQLLRDLPAVRKLIGPEADTPPHPFLAVFARNALDRVTITHIFRTK